MKLKIFSLLIAVLMSTAMLTSCSKAPAGAEGSGGSGDNLSTAQDGESSASESGAKRPTPPAGTFAAEWSGFSVYLPEESALADYGEKIAVKGDALCTGSGDSAAEFAKIISVDPVENAAAPFERCDEQYGSEAQAISDSEPGAGIKYRAYDFQTAVQTEAFGEVYENKTVYCLLAGDKVVVIEFYPLRGIGISTQKTEFEKILSSVGK